MWHDRDNFIRVNEENIAPEMRNQFVKRPYGYDYRYYFDFSDFDLIGIRGISGISGIGGIGSMQLKTPYDVLSVNSVRKETFFKSFKV